MEKNGTISFPLSTADLEFFIESVTSHIDLYADLSVEGKGVQGMTVFQIEDLPQVFISKELDDTRLENRRRSTITHELGHVQLQNSLIKYKINDRNFENYRMVIACMRQTIIRAPRYDWMEWQASYASGAYLMPKSYVNKIASEVHDLIKSNSLLNVNSSAGRGLLQRIKNNFRVSNLAAKVRLMQLGYLTNDVVLEYS